MKIQNYFYIKSEKDLKLLFELIRDNFNSMKKDETKSATVKFKDSAVGQTCIVIKWNMKHFLFPEDELKVTRIDADADIDLVDR